MTGKNRRIALAVAAALALPPAFAAVPAQAAPSGGTSWQADLSTVDGDDAGVAYAGGALRASGPEAGYLVLPERKLDRRVNRVVAGTQGTGAFEVDVRGKLGGQDWTEWTPASGGAAVLPADVSTVQVRVEADPGSAVTGVELTADEAPQLRAAAAATPLTYKVFATREGLTGGTTANGHVIASRDHFVALPSGRGLAPKATGDYTVRVCKTDGSRCEYTPVWDVGPWNTKDDYWNANRQSWTDLPQGKPEAQAAYQDGYNGGKDEFGRKVANPAGIDLGDGTFLDGLQLSDNGWVNVTYLWTGSGPTGTVKTAGDPMNVRSSASTSASIKGLAANYAKVTIECYVEGDSVTGTYGTSVIWDRIGPGHYVSDSYLYTGSDEPVAPHC
ncbi:hypothetical protein FHX82_006630 [Amycolatopsis bartoniae]|uniref:Secreted protein n=1 Tax=Amycolatopsis bartoniae TaxID=941986 RepID=A0A8H9ITA9_9PSEU|nr:hypothetical protein [Amycolatopsis bartoniae]MBB2939544.1 hypothetical protein [Amycolatopsis bartoniae]GHF39071.1 hypothetical protein GCM10017566_10450 [Amycolatopsis bartoniae]